MNEKKLTLEAELEILQRESFSYFMQETNPKNGLVIDKNAPSWPASIAAMGLALTAYPVSEPVRSSKGMDITLAFRHRPGTDHFDGRELSQRIAMAADEGLSLRCRRIEAGGLRRRLA